MPPIFGLRELFGQVLQVELALCASSRPCAGFFRVDYLRGLSTSATMSPCRECGWRCARDRNHPAHPSFAGADQLDWFAGDGAYRQGRATAAVAVDARQHDAGDAHAFVEILRARLTASWRSGRRRRAGFHAGARLLISAISIINGSSICVRPAVSNMTTS